MPPVDPSYKSGFVGWTIEQIHCFIDDDTDYEVDDRVFIIADERTAVDETVVLVQCEKVYEGATEGNQNETGGRHGKKISTVRIAGKDVNSKAICVDVAVMSVVELAGSVDADGVYREKETSPKKGGQAPRKQF
ncbi:hypothetical protein N7492_000373 [Penicillium capsulatum]|uniref:DUF6924 domain-containing protein n=1 Tax=Penicillium capsulatum TaxID=69766 RepID=A0A9W9IRR0_9EURO|nr:hypothetical protein N7492_000373 [Penicillium capsulatum]KAJ6130563.1 hypothetical protein N7512_003343 [Penicillium capsulatum]